MMQQSYIWEKFSEIIHCIPSCNKCVPIHIYLFIYW